MICTNITTALWYGPGCDHIATSSTSDDWPNCMMSATFVTYNPCTPYLSIPPRILSLDPKWTTCRRGFQALHDPPVILNSENGFSAVITTAYTPSEATKTDLLSPAQAIQQASATKTPPSRTKTKTKTKARNPASQVAARLQAGKHRDAAGEPACHPTFPHTHAAK